MIKQTGGQAFPISGSENNMPVKGMTLRDYFAGQAMQAIEPPDNYVGKEQTETSYKKWSEKAYRMADAMLSARGE